MVSNITDLKIIMAAEGSSSENQDWLAVKNWRNLQKQRERERRRMRDRERRQSMSQEERERHLARRRRNYQLRRQRALMNAHQTGSPADHGNLQVRVPETLPATHEPSSSNPSGVEVKYPYPKGLHFYQIRHLARLLNSPPGGHTQQVEPHVTTAKRCKVWRRIRLIDLKRLARALNSASKSNSEERKELHGNAQMICSKPDESISEVQQINAYSGVFAP